MALYLKEMPMSEYLCFIFDGRMCSFYKKGHCTDKLTQKNPERCSYIKIKEDEPDADT